MLKNYDIPKDDVQGKQIKTTITLNAHQTVVVFQEGEALNIVARPHPDGGVQNTFEMLPRHKAKRLLSQEEDTLASQLDQIKKTYQMDTTPGG